MNEKVVLFTALDHGGILQLANQMALTLQNMKIPFALFVPDGAKSKCAKAITEEVVEYHLSKFAVPIEKKTKDLAVQISSMKPSCFIALDDAIKASAIVNTLSKRINCAIVIHDVNPHPQKKTIYKEISERIRKHFARCAYKKAHSIILLSENSYQLFCTQYSKLTDKAMIFPLGAHVMPAVPIMPNELKQYGDIDGFALFFGRIDEYKGVDRLVKAQECNCKEPTYNLPVIIAGKNLSDKDYKTSNGKKIICLLRFINDGEMIWLFEHCGVVVLPYYEASQSGVLPIAYKYGKSVVVSNINGLRELVVEGKTGYVFKDTKQLGMILKEYAIERSAHANPEICDFYKETYDWKKNIKNLLERVVKTNE
ncbi:MAG: glycosyltransferase family 4 protein [Bacillota bacterium]|nr:glycosyltransferase family 4 protein [Bacillota bacterium]